MSDISQSEFVETVNPLAKTDIVRETEGFRMLTLEQQQKVTESLGLKPINQTINCHKAIATIENKSFEQPYTLRFEGFFDANYFNLPVDQTRVEEADVPPKLLTEIQSVGFPCIVFAGSNIELQDVSEGIKRPSSFEPSHSFLVLGPSDGDIICWEKSGYQGSYDTPLLKDEYTRHKSNNVWGVRKLNSPKVN